MLYDEKLYAIMMATYNLISEGRGANFKSNNPEKDELQRRIMKGTVCRSKEKLIFSLLVLH